MNELVEIDILRGFFAFGVPPKTLGSLRTL